MNSIAEESRQKAPIKSTKSVSFCYSSSDELRSLFEEFRLMCNDAIRVAIREKPKNRFELTKAAYANLKQYGLHCHYVLAACEVAYSAYVNKKRRTIPYVKKAFLKLDNESYMLYHLLLRIPTRPGNYIFLTLHGSEYHLSFIDDPKLKRGSVTINPDSVAITFSKEVEPFQHTGFMGIDINERNVTASSTDGLAQRFDELGEVVEIKERYREIRSTIRGRLEATGKLLRISWPSMAKEREIGHSPAFTRSHHS